MSCFESANVDERVEDQPAVGGFDDIVAAATTSGNATKKIIDRATIMKSEIESKIQALRAQVLKLKSAEDET